MYNDSVSYFSVPKNACTSLKLFFFELENGFSFKNYRANGVLKHIHNVYGSKPFVDECHVHMEHHWKATVVRDPVKRFLSCYRNRVVFHKDLCKGAVREKVEKRGLPLIPSLGDFIRYFEEYRKISQSIRRHSEPQTFFLGTNKDYYDAIYSFKEINNFVSDVEKRVGRSSHLLHEQSGGPSITIEDLSQDELRCIMDFYESDYEVFGNKF